ncbi:MAG: methyltransferase domain-containing protein [Candidatus Omnitrophota bacterium]
MGGVMVLNTGERPIINRKFEQADRVHQIVYEMSAKFINKQSQVLDYGCAGGYGSEYLSRFTQNKVVGYDINAKVINQAALFFKDIGHLEFTTALNLSCKFDVIVCSQMIEHISRDEGIVLIKKFLNYLKPQGILFLATVNKYITSHNKNKPVFPFHKYEYYPEDLFGILKLQFDNVLLFGQFNEEEIKTDFHAKLISTLSQIEIVRKIARIMPLPLKNMIIGKRKKIETPYQISKNVECIRKSYVIIYQCYKSISR